MSNNELAVEEVNVSEDAADDILKVFVYNSKGEKVREDLYSDFLNSYDFVLTHNSSNPDDAYNIYPGTVFPPKGYKWSQEKGDWVEINLYEKWKRGELEIPNDCFVVANSIIRKSLYARVRDGEVKLPPDQKVDEEYDVIIQKSKQELIDENLLSWEEVYNYYYYVFKKKIDDYLEVVYLKYPKIIYEQFEIKAKIAREWLELSEDTKLMHRSFEFNHFTLLISEFKNTHQKEYTLEEIENELTKLSQKIVQKNNQMNERLGKINSFFDSLHAEIDALKEEKNFMKLFDFVSGIENKINQWIKS